MDTNGELEKPKTEEIPLDNPAARALGNGLRQIFTDKWFTETSKYINMLKEKSNEEFVTEDLNIINTGLTRINDYLKAFGNSKKITVIPDRGDWSLKFSEDKLPTEELPQPGEIILGENLSRKIKGGFYDYLANSITPVIGYSGNLAERFADPETRKDLKDIARESSSIYKKFELAIPLGEKSLIKLLTDSRGKTTISSIPAEQPSKEVNLNS